MHKLLNFIYMSDPHRSFAQGSLDWGIFFPPIVSDIGIFVLKRDVKLQLTNSSPPNLAYHFQQRSAAPAVGGTIALNSNVSYLQQISLL